MRARLCLALAAGAMVAGPALATTRSSFLDVDGFTGIGVSNVGLTYTVSLAPGALMIENMVGYQITDVIGFYALTAAGGPDFTPLYSLANHDDNPLSIHFGDDSSNAGPGGIQGWKSNPNQGIQANEVFSFTFSNLDLSKVESFGFHVRLNGTFPGTTGNTGNFTGTLVPAPSAGVLAGLAGLGMLGRRRRR